MAFSPDDIYKLFITKRTQVEMMRDRGNLISDEETQMFLHLPIDSPIPEESLVKFVTRYIPEGGKVFSREELTQSYVNSNDELTYVYFAPSTVKDKQGVGIVNIFIKDLEDLSADYGIIVTNEGFTPDAKRSLEALTKPIIQIFFDSQLYANPTRHVIVPKQTRLTPEERSAFFAKTRIKPREIIAISIDDPIVCYYGWRIGDLIEVERVNLSTSKTMARSSLSYRMISGVRFGAEKKTTAKVTS